MDRGKYLSLFVRPPISLSVFVSVAYGALVFAVDCGWTFFNLFNELKWGIHLTQAATRCCGRAKASTKKRIPRLLLWRGVGLRSASDSRSCRPKAATAMNSRVGRLGGHSHDSRNLTFLFRSREATTHRVYLNEVDTPLELIQATVGGVGCAFAKRSGFCARRGADV